MTVHGIFWTRQASWLPPHLHFLGFNMDGIVSFNYTDTIPTTLSLFLYCTEELREETQYLEYEVLLASLARSVRVPGIDNSAGVRRVSGDAVYRVSGADKGSGKSKPQAKTHI